MKKIIGIIIVMLLITTAVSSLGMSSEYNPFDGGWIENYDNFKILHVNGLHYNMGYQHGYLLSDEIIENFRAFLNFTDFHLGLDYDFYNWYWNKLKERLNKEGSESVTNCHQLKLEAADGKKYLTDVAE